MRGGYSYIVKDYNFNAMVTGFEGVNSLLADHDFFHAVIQAQEDGSVPYKPHLVSYFGTNPYLSKVMDYVTPKFKDSYMRFLKKVSPEYTPHGELVFMLDQLKHQYTGRL